MNFSAQNNHLIGFYTKEPFWCQEPIDFSEFESWELNYMRARSALSERMHERILNVKGYSYEVGICRDGLVTFSFDGIEEHYKHHPDNLPGKWEDILQYANVIYLVMEQAIALREEEVLHHLLPFSELTKDDILSISYDQQGRFLGFVGPVRSYAYHQVLTRELRNYQERVPVQQQWDLNRRQIFQEKYFRKIRSDLDHIIKNEQLENFALLARSISEHRMGNALSAFVLAFLIFERYVNKLFTGLSQHQEELDLRSNLSMKMCVIHGQRIIGDKLYDLLKHINKRRNKIIHPQRRGDDLTKVEWGDDCMKLYDAIRQLQGLLYPDIRYTYFGSIQHRGI